MAIYDLQREFGCCGDVKLTVYDALAGKAKLISSPVGG